MTLLERAREAGLELRVENGKVMAHGPRRLAPLVEEIRQHKAEVMADLAEDEALGRYREIKTAGGK